MTPRELAVEQAKVLHNLIELSKASKIQDTFFKAFREAHPNKDGRSYLHGNFNITGTKSGRLSSSDPNLTNLPSTGSKYAKMTKDCFRAGNGWIFLGADFESLEDKISALTTKDKNKLRVYTEGYDGHSLRAYAFFKEQMSDIDPTSVESINSIAKKYKSLRQDAKMPQFLLTYGGTYIGIMEQGGFSEKEAKSIEANYHELYKESDQWVANKIKEACKTGYVEVAFGLRLRTPLLVRTDIGKSYTPYQAQKEARTAGNALGQSYCLLNNRAAIEFMSRVNKSAYRLDIKLVCLIHDAIYLLVRDDIKIVKWVNDNLTECMAWQDLPELQHPIVKLSGSVELFYPSWVNGIPIPKNSTESEIRAICKEALEKLK